MAPGKLKKKNFIDQSIHQKGKLHYDSIKGICSHVIELASSLFGKFMDLAELPKKELGRRPISSQYGPNKLVQ